MRECSIEKTFFLIFASKLCLAEKSQKNLEKKYLDLHNYIFPLEQIWIFQEKVYLKHHDSGVQFESTMCLCHPFNKLLIIQWTKKVQLIMLYLHIQFHNSPWLQVSKLSRRTDSEILVLLGRFDCMFDFLILEGKYLYSELSELSLNILLLSRF